MSNALAQRLGHAHTVKDNGWFVGVTPRRNPEIVVAVLIEGGEHGYLAARMASQIIKAYVEKQKRVPNKVAGDSTKKTEVGAVWSGPSEEGSDALRAGHFYLDRDAKPAQRLSAAPGMLNGQPAPQLGMVIATR